MSLRRQNADLPDSGIHEKEPVLSMRRRSYARRAFSRQPENRWKPDIMSADRAGQHSPCADSRGINDQYRICLWREGNAFDVEVVDYR